MPLRWHWVPGAGGLLALVPPHRLAVGDRGVVLPTGATPVQPLHLTCLRSASMAPLVGLLDPGELVDALPPMPMPELHPTVWVAHRPPHPTKDAVDCTLPRRTGFLAATPSGQRRCQVVLEEVVHHIDRACRRAGAGPFPHPEPQRFFHISVWNNRGGDSHRSIGDICAEDTES